MRGWVDVSDVDALDLARSMAGRGVKTIVYTDIARDGMLIGPNVEAMRRMAEAVPEVAVIASGGVGALGDVLDLAEDRNGRRDRRQGDLHRQRRPGRGDSSARRAPA